MDRNAGASWDVGPLPTRRVSSRPLLGRFGIRRRSQGEGGLHTRPGILAKPRRSTAPIHSHTGRARGRAVNASAPAPGVGGPRTRRTGGKRRGRGPTESARDVRARPSQSSVVPGDEAFGTPCHVRRLPGHHWRRVLLDGVGRARRAGENPKRTDLGRRVGQGTRRTAVPPNSSHGRELNGMSHEIDGPYRSALFVERQSPIAGYAPWL